ncbi:MAG: long-chain fatty acid--CoA ligase [Bacteroidetes bacterium]|nr:long-chain fatty acid--CoA ligase [Bacteroidota bacterium]
MTDVQRLFDIADHQLAAYPQPMCVASLEGGVLRTYSTQEFIDTATSLALGLMSIGIGPGDRVAVASGNRAEWALLDQAILRIGAISVPIYPTSSAEDYAYVLHHSETKAFFVSNPDILAKALAARPQVPSLAHLFTFDPVPGTPHWKELLGKGAEGRATLEAHMARVERMDLATIIYTSGTTGRPKGVMLSHDNILSNVEASMHRLPVSSGARAISFLPLCHIYERMLMYLYMRAGMQVRFQETLDELGARIKEVRPEVFTAVPRLLEKIYDAILAKGEQLTGLKRKLFFWSLDLGERYEVKGRGPWYDLQLAVARKLVFSKWREALGGQVRCVASGSAALQPRLARIFNAAGVPLMEGYGLTETSPVVSVNDARNDGLRFGTVGRPLENVQVRIAPDGEVLVKAPSVMMGYYREPELTAEVLDADGWLHTGDIGELTAEGFLRITDRKKEMFKTSGGKYVAPQLIENKLKGSRFIEQAMVIGENRKFPAALVVPSFPFLKDYCALKGIPYTSNEQVVKEPRIVERIFAEVQRVNEGLGHWEQVKKIALLPTEWSVDGGEMTPKLSLRRKPILAKYAAVVEGLYAGN